MHGEKIMKKRENFYSFTFFTQEKLLWKGFSNPLRTYMTIGKYFEKKKNVSEIKYNCEFGQLETLEQILKNYTLYPIERKILKTISQELDLCILFDNQEKFRSGGQVF